MGTGNMSQRWHRWQCKASGWSLLTCLDCGFHKASIFVIGSCFHEGFIGEVLFFLLVVRCPFDSSVSIVTVFTHSNVIERHFFEMRKCSFGASFAARGTSFSCRV